MLTPLFFLCHFGHRYSSNEACRAALSTLPSPYEITTTTLRCGSDVYAQRFGDRGYGNPFSWGCLGLGSLAGNVSRPSTLPESEPFACKMAPHLLGYSEPTPNYLDTSATICNGISKDILVFTAYSSLWPGDAGTKLAPGGCHTYQASHVSNFDISLLLYTPLGVDNQWVAAGWTVASNPAVGWPYAGIQGDIFWYSGSCTYFRETTKFSEGEEQTLYSSKYGSQFTAVIKRNNDAGDAKQFSIKVTKLEGNMTEPSSCDGTLQKIVTWPTSTLVASGSGSSADNSILDTTVKICNSLSTNTSILVYKADSTLKRVDKGTLIAPKGCSSWRDYQTGSDDVQLLVYRPTGSGTTYTAAAWVAAKNPAIGYPAAGVQAQLTELSGVCSTMANKHSFSEGETWTAEKSGHYKVPITRNGDSDGSKQFYMKVEELAGQIDVATSCSGYIDLSVNYG